MLFAWMDPSPQLRRYGEADKAKLKKTEAALCDAKEKLVEVEEERDGLRDRFDLKRKQLEARITQLQIQRKQVSKLETKSESVSATEEEVPECISCAICMERAVDRVIVQCGHTFCGVCLSQQDIIKVPTTAGGNIRKTSCAICNTGFWLKDASNQVRGGKAGRMQAEQKKHYESLSVNGEMISGVQKIFLNRG